MKIKPQFLQNISIKDQLLCTQITTWVKKTTKTYELHSGYNNYADFTFLSPEIIECDLLAISLVFISKNKLPIPLFFTSSKASL